MREQSAVEGASSSGMERAVVASRNSPLPSHSSAVGEAGNSDVVVVLRKAHSLVLRGWCRTHLAVDATGTSTFHRSAGEPVAFSLLGALKTGTLAGYHAQKVMCRVLGVGTVAELQEWNDHPLRTKREVLDALRRAIHFMGGGEVRRGGWRVGGAL